MIQRAVDEVNNQAQSRVHTIKKWLLLDKEFTVARGELTPTLKIKRNVIANMYESTIKEIYSIAKL